MPPKGTASGKGGKGKPLVLPALTNPPSSSAGKNRRRSKGAQDLSLISPWLQMVVVGPHRRLPSHAGSPCRRGLLYCRACDCEVGRRADDALAHAAVNFATPGDTHLKALATRHVATQAHADAAAGAEGAAGAAEAAGTIAVWPLEGAEVWREKVARLVDSAPPEYVPREHLYGFGDARALAAVAEGEGGGAGGGGGGEGEAGSSKGPVTIDMVEAVPGSQLLPYW